ncbi:MAG: NAD-dependent epimerase/dehydratase family protein [Bacteroidota bacterium]|nr:MAG: NAD-dependent epimerase/dehydratase family protein [Bacteroidota bacterium]
MILVTGSTGLVGSHLLYLLLKEGYAVRALVRNLRSIEKARKVFSYYTSDPEKFIQQADWFVGDVNDPESLVRSLEGIKQVYHCAAVVSFNNRDLDSMWQVNVNGTANLVNACLEMKVGKFLHVSSIATLGHTNDGKPLTENCPWPAGKISPYSRTKMLAEQEVQRAMAEGLTAVILNPSVILGPGDWENGSGRLFWKVYRGMNFFTRGITGFVDVRDVTKVMVALMNSTQPNERYIVSAQNKSYEEVLREIALRLGLKPPRYFAKPWMTEMAWLVGSIISVFFGRPATLSRWTARTAHRKQNYSSEKLIRALDFQFTPFEETIRHTVACFRRDYPA